MNIRVDKSGPIPVGMQIKESIRLLIRTGELKEGDRLPSIHQLAEQLQVNKNTIVGVYKELDREGYIRSSRGSGVYVQIPEQNLPVDEVFLHRFAGIIKEARRRGMVLQELVNLAGMAYNDDNAPCVPRALFIMGITREILGMNLDKLVQGTNGIEIEGLFLAKGILKSEVETAMQKADLIIVPDMLYGTIKELIPKKIPVIRTRFNLEPFEGLIRGIEKKARVGVIGHTQSWVDSVEAAFIGAGFFKPKIAISVSEIDKYKKELKEMETFILCRSLMNKAEKLKPKSRTLYYYYDYIDADSIDAINRFAENFSG